MPDQLTVFARITPKSEHLDSARQAISSIISATQAEPGCRAFELHGEWEGSEHLYLYEVWDSEAALAAHHAQPYTQAVFDSYRDWLSEPVEITMLKRIG